MVTISGAILGLLTVVIGAFGAHALQGILLQNGRVDTFETGVNYQGIHALAMLAIGQLVGKIDEKSLKYAGMSMLAGVVVFSGSLYVLSLTNVTFLGAVTPFGGLLMIAGWVILIAAIYRSRP